MEVNEDKTELMVSTVTAFICLDKSVSVGNRYNFEVVHELIYLGSAVIKNSNFRLLLANRCYFGISKHFRDKALTQTTNIQQYQTLIPPVLLYASES